MEYDIRPLQLRTLKLLRQFQEVCREHGLRWYATAGTMLGAVRHAGFIPWDDDMDIAMPRPDYDRLIVHAAEWLPRPMELVCAELDESYPLPFAKLQDASTTILERPHLPFLGGIYIDIFPIDGVPAGGLRRLLHTSPATSTSSECSTSSTETPTSMATAPPPGSRCLPAKCIRARAYTPPYAASRPSTHATNPRSWPTTTTACAE